MPNKNNLKPYLRVAAVAFAAVACQIANSQTWYVGTTNANSTTMENQWHTAVGSWNSENFDSYSVNTPFGNIATVGLTVRTYQDNTQALVTNGGATFTHSGSQFLWNTSHLQTYFDANGPMTAFAYWAAGGDSDVHRVTLLDSNNNVIGSNTVIAEAVLPCFIGVTTTTNIASVLIEPLGNGGTQDSLAFDDIQTNAPVPEPVTCISLGVGILALLRRRLKS
jgi:hypothetical protein